MSEGTPTVSTHVWDANLHFGYWSSAEDDSSLPEATDRLTDMMIQRIRAPRGGRLLDVGCGLGKPACRLARATGASVTGISIDSAQVDEANARAAEEGLAGRVRFEQADAMDLPYPDDSFDGAWALESILHMPDRERVFRQIARVLRPGGRLVLTDLFVRAPLDEESGGAVRTFLEVGGLNPAVHTIEEYVAMLRGAGMRCAEFVDITSETLRNYEMLRDSLRENREELAAVHGAASVADWERAFDGCVTAQEPGYLLLAAVVA